MQLNSAISDMMVETFLRDGYELPHDRLLFLCIFYFAIFNTAFALKKENFVLKKFLLS